MEFSRILKKKIKISRRNDLFVSSCRKGPDASCIRQGERPDHYWAEMLLSGPAPIMLSVLKLSGWAGKAACYSRLDNVGNRCLRPNHRPQVFSRYVTVFNNINSARVRVLVSCGPRCLYTVAVTQTEVLVRLIDTEYCTEKKAVASPPYRLYLENGRTKVPVVSQLHSTVL